MGHESLSTERVRAASCSPPASIAPRTPSPSFGRVRPSSTHRPSAHTGLSRDPCHAVSATTHRLRGADDDLAHSGIQRRTRHPAGDAPSLGRHAMRGPARRDRLRYGGDDSPSSCGGRSRSCTGVRRRSVERRGKRPRNGRGLPSRKRRVNCRRDTTTSAPPRRVRTARPASPAAVTSSCSPLPRDADQGACKSSDLTLPVTPTHPVLAARRLDRRCVSAALNETAVALMTGSTRPI